ncbi:MAG: PDZ domain-containing protein [Pseudomonadota bacterium]
MTRLILATLLLGLAPALHAANIQDLDVGDGMYLQGVLSDELVYVVRIDRSRNRVKVRRSQDGTTKWVNPSQLIDREASVTNDVGRVAVGVGLFVCLANPDACKSSSSSGSSTARSTSTVWRPGSAHSQYANVIASDKKNVWRPADGYQWVDRGNSWKVSWKPGLAHSRHANVVSSDSPNNWSPQAGYTWVDKDSSWRVKWTPQRKHPSLDKVVSCDAVGKWCPQRGYRWKDLEKGYDVVWTEGTNYGRGRPNVVAAAQEGYWLPAAGYDWLERDQLTVKWVPAKRHPTNSRLTSEDAEGYWLYRGGVGVSIQLAEDVPKITLVHEGSPAAKAGVTKDVFLLQVDGKSTSGLKLEEVIALLAGKPNSAVQLVCLDGSTGKQTNHRVVRGNYRFKM